MRPGFWTRFQSFFSSLTIFYLDDSVVVAGTWAGSYGGIWIENSVDSGGNLVDETEQGIGVEVIALLLRSGLTP